MEILTSIAPKHRNANAQETAVSTWLDHGLKPVSINSHGEVLIGYPEVKQWHTTSTASLVMKAPYVLVSSFIEYARQNDLDHAIIVNSDIAIKDVDNRLEQYIAASENGLVFANRYDHNGDFANPTRYEHGFDAFIIHKKYFDLIPCSMFCMGQTWWDYWVPFRFIKSGVPIQLVKEPIFLHQRHPVQYDMGEWARMTDHFVWMEQWQGRKQPQQVTNEVYRLIKQHAR